MSAQDPFVQNKEPASPALEIFQQAHGQIAEQANHLRDMATDARYHSEDFIQSNPWTAVAVAAGLGLLVGIFIGRR